MLNKKILSIVSKVLIFVLLFGNNSFMTFAESFDYDNIAVETVYDINENKGFDTDLVVDDESAIEVESEDESENEIEFENGTEIESEIVDVNTTNNQNGILENDVLNDTQIDLEDSEELVPYADDDLSKDFEYEEEPEEDESEEEVKEVVEEVEENEESDGYVLLEDSSNTAELVDDEIVNADDINNNDIVNTATSVDEKDIEVDDTVISDTDIEESSATTEESGATTEESSATIEESSDTTDEVVTIDEEILNVSTDSIIVIEEDISVDDESVVIATQSNLDDIIAENQELIDFLSEYDIVLSDEYSINFMKNLTYQFDDDNLICELDGKKYLVDQNFVNTYAHNNSLVDGVYGVVPEQKIILDFGINMPNLADSLNWNNASCSDADEDPNTFSIKGSPGSLIYNYFGSDTLALIESRIPYTSFGSGVHIVLPRFGEIWNGFRFVGWIDKDNLNLSSTQNNCFLYAFQYEEAEVRYTASWEKVTTNTQNFRVKYLRATYSQAMSDPFVADQSINYFEFSGGVAETKHINDYIYMDAPDIYGYTVSSVRISTTSPMSNEPGYQETGAESLRNLAYDGVTYIALDPTEDLTLTGYTLEGTMPNHDVYIEIFYVPNPMQKSTVYVNHYAENGNVLKAGEEIMYDVESIVNISSASDIASYEYARTEVVALSSNIANNMYALGFMHTSDEKFTTEDVNAANGKFVAVMPNQNVYINYYYRIDSNLEVPFYVRLEKQNEDGTYDISTTSQTINIGSSHVYTVTVENLEDEGYAIPVISTKHIVLQGFDYANEELRYYVEDTEEHVLTITYAYNYSSDYWTKLGFNQLTDGHGSISAATGSKALTERYIKKNETYTLAQLTANITVTVDTNYKLVWYKNRTSGIGKVGDPLPETGIQLTESNYNLFASFEEDPNCFVDITFTNADNCSISGTTSYHLVKNVETNTITFPTVVTNQGYSHYNNEWLDETGAVLGTVFTATHTYKPHIVANFVGSAAAVKPVSYITYDAQGKGQANLFGVYSQRKYILTDRNDVILEIKNADAAKNNGFSNLNQGTTYHLYEALETVTLPNVGEPISTSLPNISERYVLGVRALNGNYSLNTTTNAITVNPKTGISYALLDDRYNIVTDWTTTPTFTTGITKGTYYLVVAKESSDTALATDDDVIRNGEAVFISSNDLSTRKYRLVIAGNPNAFAQGAGSVTNISGMKVYEVSAGTSVTVRGSNNYKTYALTNNVAIRENDISNTFNMPEQDVVITNYNSTDTDTNKILVYNALTNLSVLNLESIKQTLNSDANIANALTNNCTVVNNLVINRYATKKATVQGLTSGISPYEYTIDVQTTVLGLPYVSSNVNSADYTAYLALDKKMVGNSNYQATSGSANCLYTTNEHEIGMLEFVLSTNNANAIKYVKTHKVSVSSNTPEISYNEDFYVEDSHNLTTATNYANLSARLVNAFDNGSDMDAREYLYQDIKEGTTVYDVNANITNYKTLQISYVLNQQREDNKSLLSIEINTANVKYNTLSNDAVKQTLQDAITVATSTRNTQKNYTADQLYAAYETLRTARDNAQDPQATVNLDANGGQLSDTSITITVGDNYTYSDLSAITATKEGDTFDSWNTMADGTGITVSSGTIVGQTPFATLFAIWLNGSSDTPVDPAPTPNGGGGSGGGGGGGGGITLTRQKVLIDQPQVTVPLDVNKLLLANNPTIAVQGAVDNFFKGRSAVVYEAQGADATLNLDPLTMKYNLKIGNVTTKDNYRSQWVTIFAKDGSSKTYRTDENGNLIVGKFVGENNNVYYLNDKMDANFGSIQVGWIFDNATNSWYYSSPLNGALVTGWNTIDGKDYYFFNPMVPVNNNNNIVDITNKAVFGVMLKDIVTPDGFVLDSNGQRVEQKPYLK